MCVSLSYMKTLALAELKIGDVVKFVNGNGPNAEMTVIQKTKDLIVLFRPFVLLSDFTCSDGAIPYLGTEKIEFKLSTSTNREVNWIGNIYFGMKTE